MKNSHSTWLSWPEAPNLLEKQHEQAGLRGSPLRTHGLPGPRGCCPAEAETHLGLLLPERECLLLVQHLGNDHEAELASKLPVKEGARGMRAGTLESQWAGSARGSRVRSQPPAWERRAVWSTLPRSSGL